MFSGRNFFYLKSTRAVAALLSWAFVDHEYCRPTCWWLHRQENGGQPHTFIDLCLTFRLVMSELPPPVATCALMAPNWSLDKHWPACFLYLWYSVNTSSHRHILNLSQIYTCASEICGQFTCLHVCLPVTALWCHWCWKLTVAIPLPACVCIVYGELEAATGALDGLSSSLLL